MVETGQCEFFAGPEYCRLAEIDLSADADNIRVDLPEGRLLVGCGGGGIGIIDSTPTTTRLDHSSKAHPEGFQLDAGTHQIFVNLPITGRLPGLTRLVARSGNLATPLTAGNFPRGGARR
jgi:hypothetical protein